MADRWFARITYIKPKNKQNEAEEEDLELQEEDVWGCYMTDDSEDSKKKLQEKKKSVSFSWPPPYQSPAAWGLQFTSSPPKMKLARSKSCDNEIKKFCVEHSLGPVKIPDWSQIYKTGVQKRCVPDDEDYDGDDEMIPPHEYIAIQVAKGRARTVSYSMLEGIGRTLKGRDLLTLRNAVLLKTGYLD